MTTGKAEHDQAEFRRLVREMFECLQEEPAGASFANVEGGSVEQQRDRRLQLHHCANYAAVLAILQASSRSEGTGASPGTGRGLRILELGCGTGALSHALARLAPSGWHLVATDYSRQLVEHARARHRRENLGFEQLDARTLRAEQLGRFDAVLLLEVIEHLPRDEASGLLRRLHAGLRPGAVLVLSTLDRTPFPRPFSGYAPHFVEYTYDSLVAFLADPKNSPFERLRVSRLVSPRMAGEAVRAEQRGGYLANRVQRFALGLAGRSPALRRLYGLASAAAFRVYAGLPRRGAFHLEEYLATLELVQFLPETRGADSFGLVAVLERC